MEAIWYNPKNQKYISGSHHDELLDNPRNLKELGLSSRYYNLITNAEDGEDRMQVALMNCELFRVAIPGSEIDVELYARTSQENDLAFDILEMIDVLDLPKNKTLIIDNLRRTGTKYTTYNDLRDEIRSGKSINFVEAVDVKRTKTFKTFLREVFDSPDDYNPDMDLVRWSTQPGSSNQALAIFDLGFGGTKYQLVFDKVTPYPVKAIDLLRELLIETQDKMSPHSLDAEDVDEIPEQYLAPLRSKYQPQIEKAQQDLLEKAFQEAHYADYISTPEEWEDVLGRDPLKNLLPPEKYYVPTELNKYWTAKRMANMFSEEAWGRFGVTEALDNWLIKAMSETPDAWWYFYLRRKDQIVSHNHPSVFEKYWTSKKDYAALTFYVESVVKYLESTKEIPMFSISSEDVAELVEELMRTKTANRMTFPPDPRFTPIKEALSAENTMIVLANVLWTVDDIKHLNLPNYLLVDDQTYYVSSDLEKTLKVRFENMKSEGDFRLHLEEEMSNELDEIEDKFTAKMEREAYNKWKKDTNQESKLPSFEDLGDKLGDLMERRSGVGWFYSVELYGGKNSGTVSETTRVFGLVSSIMYQMSDKYNIGGFVFYGSTGSRHKLYKRMLMNKKFQSAFKKLKYTVFLDGKYKNKGYEHTIISKELLALKTDYEKLEAEMKDTVEKLRKAGGIQ